MNTCNVGYLIASLSSTSINRKLALALIELAPANLQMSEISFQELPPYRQDYDADYPPVARAFKEAIRPYGENAFARKPTAVIGASPGSIGTAVGQQSLRAVLGFCNAPQMTSPEAYIQFTPGLVGDDGQVTVESTANFLRNYMKEFALFIQRVTTVLPRE